MCLYCTVDRQCCQGFGAYDTYVSLGLFIFRFIVVKFVLCFIVMYTFKGGGVFTVYGID